MKAERGERARASMSIFISASGGLMGRAFWGASGVSCLGMGLALRVASQRAQPRSLRGGKATRGCLQILETGSKIWRGLRGAPRACCAS